MPGMRQHFFLNCAMRYLVVLFLLISSNSYSQDVPVYDFKGFKAFLEKDNDTVYVINFWATWCKPCVEELPAFEKINAEYEGRPLKVILVSIDFAEKLEKQVKPFVLKKGLKSQVVLLDDPDANSWINQVDSSWGGSIPGTLIYKGSVRYFHEGSMSYEELQSHLTKFILPENEK